MYRLRKQTLVTLLVLLVFVSPAQAEINIDIAEIQNGFVHVEGNQAPRAQAIFWDGVSVGVNSNNGGAFHFDTTNLPPNCVGTLKIGSETRKVVINNCTPAAITVFQAGVPKTGQTTSDDPNSPQRDDGALQKGVAWPSPRFTDNSNGTITDNLTGLIWLTNANCLGGETTWYSALTFVAGINSGSANCGDTSNAGNHQTDWRLPNVRELHSLINYGAFGPSLPAGHPFSNFQSANYWSSTSFANDAGVAWLVNFRFAPVVDGDGKAGVHFVTAVRGGS
jgi:hypothetical protein